MFHAVVANNTVERAGGLIVEGLNHGHNTFMPVYFIETLHNRIVESISLTGAVAGITASGQLASQSRTSCCKTSLLRLA